MPNAVERVIATMWQQYDQPLSLAEMADKAIYSRFYFARVFRATTGTSPGRYLSAVRLCKAKHLLLQTSDSVTDISYQVGYNSPGTFSTRFTLSVGLSPARYRQQAQDGMISPPSAPRPVGGTSGRIACWLWVPRCSMPTKTYIGVFSNPYQQGMTVTCQVADGSGIYQLENAAEGPLTIRAVTVPTSNLDPRPWARRPVLLSNSVEITVSAGRTTPVSLRMRPPRITDPPVLIALPEMDSLRLGDQLLMMPDQRSAAAGS
jgi:AraC family transcriptional regulator